MRPALVRHNSAVLSPDRTGRSDGEQPAVDGQRGAVDVVGVLARQVDGGRRDLIRPRSLDGHGGDDLIELPALCRLCGSIRNGDRLSPTALRGASCFGFALGVRERHPHTPVPIPSGRSAWVIRRSVIVRSYRAFVHPCCRSRPGDASLGAQERHRARLMRALRELLLIVPGPQHRKASDVPHRPCPDRPRRRT